MTHRTVNQAALALTLLTGLLLTGCASNTPSSATPAGPEAGAVSSVTHSAILVAPTLPDGKNLRPLRELNGEKIPMRIQSLALNGNTNVVGLKVLILTAGTTDADLSSAKAMLDQAGVPYDVVDASVPGAFSASTLVASDGTGNYQGVILTTGNLAYESSPGVWGSALDPASWSLLWQYETDYQVRQLSLYTYPSSWPEDYGLRDAGAASGTAAPLLTATGKTVLTDLKAGMTLPINNAYNYPATLASVPDISTQPLLQDAAGRVLAATSNTGGRERLALTFAQNPYLLHTSLLGYSLVNWLTKGVHIGEYRRYNQLDIDDWFLPGDVFSEVTHTIAPDAFRISASDAVALAAQQQAFRNSYPVSNNFILTVMYNGSGANTRVTGSCNPAVLSADPLSSVSRCLGNTFSWVSHTYDHAYMDFLNYADSYAQLQPNLSVGARMGLNINTHSLVTGDMSGLGYYNPAGDGPKTNYGLGASNTAFLQAAVDSGDQYLSSNHSVDGQWDPNCTNCGIVHPLNSGIFLVPRWPTNIAYHVTNPAQETAYYNSVYGPSGSAPYWDHNLSYSEILDKETDLAISHLLSGGAFPHYMHQNNLRQYAPGRSLAFDWETALLNKYTRYSTLPLNTLRWDDLGAYMKARTSFMKSGLSGRWDRTANTLTLTAGTGGAQFVTGAALGTSENYAGQTISNFNLSAGQTVTVNVP